MGRALPCACVLLVLLIFGPSCRAQEPARDFTSVAAKLFPEAENWTLVSAMKPADTAYLRENEQKLKEAYAAAEIKTGLESEHCSFIERAFSDRYGFPQGFYIDDLDVDGLPDVMYAGGAECGEGNATVVWYGTSTGFAVKQPSIENSMVLRVKEGKAPRLCSVAWACCAGQIDEYFIGNLLDAGLDVERELSVEIKTVMPSVVEHLPVSFLGEGRELILRSSPSRNDTYDKVMSKVMGAPVFGTALAKYRSGCTGVILARLKDAESRLWFFVALDKKCEALSTQDPYGANVGWVEGKGLSPLAPGKRITPDYPRISALLFPETKSWTLVSGMKAASEAFLRANEARMREAYSARAMGMDADRDGACALMERLFSSDAPYTFPEGFYVHDVDHDGRRDIIYAAHNPCGEGNITIVWFATKDGFVIKQETLGNTLALRVKGGNPSRMSFVSVGCCGDRIDVYSVGTLAEAPAPGGRRVVDDLQLAPEDEKPVPFAAGDTGFVLRSSSAIDNAYIKSSEEAVGFPVFGNIIGKYPAGCTGNVVGRLTDARSRLWYFVTLDRDCDSLRTQDGFDANAGWVEASAVSLRK